MLNKAVDRDKSESAAQELIRKLKIQNKCANCGREAESMPRQAPSQQCAVCEAVSLDIDAWKMPISLAWMGNRLKRI